LIPAIFAASGMKDRREMFLRSFWWTKRRKRDWKPH